MGETSGKQQRAWQTVRSRRQVAHITYTNIDQRQGNRIKRLASTISQEQDSLTLLCRELALTFALDDEDLDTVG
nr:unnamed protein product [Rangifer tarandus platyrhynchus]